MPCLGLKSRKEVKSVKDSSRNPSKEMSRNLSGKETFRSQSVKETTRNQPRKPHKHKSGNMSEQLSNSSLGDSSEDASHSSSRQRRLSPARQAADDGSLYTTVLKVSTLPGEDYHEVNMDQAVSGRRKWVELNKSPTASPDVKHTPSPAPSPISMRYVYAYTVCSVCVSLVLSCDPSPLICP